MSNPPKQQQTTELLIRTFNSLKKLRKKGIFFISSIEFDDDFDGEDFKNELDELINEIEKFID